MAKQSARHEDLPNQPLNMDQGRLILKDLVGTIPGETHVLEIFTATQKSTSPTRPDLEGFRGRVRRAPSPQDFGSFESSDLDYHFTNFQHTKEEVVVEGKELLDEMDHPTPIEE